MGSWTHGEIGDTHSLQCWEAEWAWECGENTKGGLWEGKASDSELRFGFSESSVITPHPGEGPAQ